MTSDYRLAQPLLARLAGTLLAVVGLLVLLVSLLVAVLSLSPVVLVVTAVLASVAMVVGGYVVTKRLTVVALGERGYRVRFVRGAGVTQARWTDVEDVVATTVAGDRCVVLRLRDGRTTTIPVRILRGSPDVFVRDLNEHLNRGHGYKRIN